ncbi:MAG: GTPase domain-containing protein, partial [Natronospirillum sp.]
MPFDFLNQNWKRIFQEVLTPKPDPMLDQTLAAQTRDAAPVFWLLGKVQSGKTSLVHAITRHPEAEIGAGFKPCTRHARQFEFPPELPLIRFIDTRGLGEVNYHPEDELTELEQQADAVLVVARALDPQQEEILAQLQQIRSRHPLWPVVLVQTRLHDAYKDDRDHPDYARLYSTPELLDLQRALRAQAEAFRNLPGAGPVHTVAVDLTHRDDGFTNP